MASLLRRSALEQALPKAALSLDVFIWLCALPLLLRFYSISALLERIASRSFRPQRAALDVEQATRIVTHVSNLRLAVLRSDGALRRQRAHQRRLRAPRHRCNVGADQQLAPPEAMSAQFRIGLHTTETFTFLVNVMGEPVE